MRSRVVAVAWAALFALLCTASAGLACKTEVDCQLNGACEGSLCVCDKGWKGEQCGTLNLDPTAHVAYGYDQSTAVPERFSSWGGGPPVRSAEDGKYHLFVSEIAAHCGMSTWDRMSTSVHAIAESIEGPYSKVETVVGTESHNTIYVYSPVDEYHLIYTIFSGIAPESCNPYIACTNGTTPNSSAGSLRPPQPWPPMTGNCSSGPRGVIHYAKSLNGPWRSAGALTVAASPKPPPVAGISNPTPYIFPNGTVIMLGRGPDEDRVTGKKNHNIFLYRAPSWNSTYTWVPADGVKGAINVGAGSDGPATEDPHLYRGRRGFHVMFHSHPDLTHGWSEDGISWNWNKTTMGPPNHMDNGGGDNERPRVVVDENGDVEWLFVGQLCGPLDAARTAAFKAVQP